MRICAATIAFVLLAAPCRAIEQADVWAAMASVNRAHEAPAPRKPVRRVPNSARPQALMQTPPASGGVLLPGPASPAWSINGDYSPDRAIVIHHLLTAKDHRGKYTPRQLERMSTEQLRRLHSADHTANRGRTVSRPGHWEYRTVCRGGRCYMTKVWVSN